ncbi:transposase [Peribacillus simplex]|uniref:transposase n=1 Tax=Peribacillus simplex TaxID=1478 RepID=UPI003D27C75A
MNPIISSELTLFAQELQRFLSPIVLQETAKQVGFVQRSSKYQANGLIALCVWLSQEVASTSLTQLCSRLEASTGVLISPEGLNQRFNPAAVAFLREVFTSLLTQKLCSNQSLSAHMISTFNRIRILEATVFQLPDYFATDYRGSGGSSLPPGETIEIPEAYMGQNQKLPARVMIHRLTDDQTQTRLKNQAIREKKKGIVMKEKSKRLMGMNVYITNTSPEEVPTDYVHSLYSLRWQIEILFKTWKSFFEIDECKTIKKERLECHLYGQLIGILLCSSTMFQMRQLLLEKKKQELSEYKAIYMIKDYFPLLFQAIAVGTKELLEILHRLYQLLKKNGRKCHRYKKMTVFDILGVVYETTVKNRKAA